MTSEHTDDIPDLVSLMTPSSRMAPVLNRFTTDRHTLERKYPFQLSPTRKNRMRSFYIGWKSRLSTLEFESYSQEERIEIVLFRNHLDFCLCKLANAETKDTEMAGLLPFAPAILKLAEARLSFDWVEPEEAASELNAITANAKTSLKALAGNHSINRTLANRAAEAVKALQKALKAWFEFYSGFNPLFNWWAEAPYKAASNVLDEYRDHIIKEIVKPDSDDAADIIGDPTGADALAAELAFEMIPYTPDELIAIARKELAWCEAEMAAAAQELGFGADTKAALEHVKGLHEPPGGQPELIKRLALEAIDYLDKYDLLSIPPLAREAWRLEMMSPEKQKVNPFFLGGEMIQVSFPTNTMSHDEKLMSMRGNNSHFSRATVQHELIPGHHMQWFMQQRSRSYREPFHTPFWVEGWTIYWEFLLYHRGFPRCPEDRIGMMFWRMHRCVRVIFSLSFHLEKMTPAECIEMLVDVVGHERANAIAEVRRSCSDAYPPLYQCAYLIGGLQMWALRKELVESGTMPEKEFHDAVLRENCIPIEMIRADLGGHDVTGSFQSNWRFYGDAPSA